MVIRKNTFFIDFGGFFIGNGGSQNLSFVPKSCLEFTDGWFPVVACHVVPLDTVGVEVVQNTDANLVSIPVIRLGLWHWLLSSGV